MAKASLISRQARCSSATSTGTRTTRWPTSFKSGCRSRKGASTGTTAHGHRKTRHQHSSSRRITSSFLTVLSRSLLHSVSLASYSPLVLSPADASGPPPRRPRLLRTQEQCPCDEDGALHHVGRSTSQRVIANTVRCSQRWRGYQSEQRWREHWRGAGHPCPQCSGRGQHMLY